MKKDVVRWIIGIYVAMHPFWGLSQSGGIIIDSLNTEDQEAIYALVLYPEDIRIAILEVCKSPEIILKLNDIKEETQQRFSEVMEGKSRTEQEKWYTLVRYPALISAISSGEYSRRAFTELLKEYPEEIHEIAESVRQDKSERKIAEIVDEINIIFNENVVHLLKPYPDPIPASVNQLIGLPEVLDILNDHFTISVRAGAMYRQHPERVLQMADSLHLIAAQRNAEELEKWKDELEQNPDARDELEAAAQEFYDEYEADPPVYRSPDVAEDREIHVYHHVDPYPYWIGYPWWYRHPYWYPRPYWHHLGFYWGSDRTMVVFNLPSYFFVSWYFDIPRHHYYYPHFSHIYIRHYERYPRSYYASTTYVGTWVQRNRYVYNRVWLVDDGRRIDRLREYGRLEDNYRRYVSRRPDGSRIMDRTAYLSSKSRSYPTLNRSRRPDGSISRRPNTDIDPIYQSRTPDRDPVRRRVETPTRDEPQRTVTPPRETDRKPYRVDPSTRKPVVRRPVRSSEQPRESSRPSEYHRGKWVRPSQRTSSPRTSPRTPSPRTKPTRTPTPRKPSTQKSRRP